MDIKDKINNNIMNPRYLQYFGKNNQDVNTFLLKCFKKNESFEFAMFQYLNGKFYFM